jgi:dTDP-4-amino-4,6-dideoxygalactose transaminase
MNIFMTDLKPQYQTIKTEVEEAISNVLQSGQFILGDQVKAFEDQIAAYCNTKYAVGVASGTDALHLALLACGISPGDEVITTPFTFIATSEAVVKCGAKPVFADIELSTFNLDPNQIASKISHRTKAILPVHLYGQPVAIEPMLDIARQFNLKVIEDCAQSLGAAIKGRKVGSFGDTGCLSFFPSKNLGAFGDGGMVITNKDEIADKVKLLRGHGAKTSYRYIEHGFNSRLDALQAAILRVKLKYLEHWNNMRRNNCKIYNELLSEIKEIKLPAFSQDVVSSCNYYTILINDNHIDRNGLSKYLETKGIQTNIYYPLSLHLQEVYSNLGYKPGDLKNSEYAQENVLSLPMYPELRREQIEEVATEIKKFIQRN